MKDERATDEQVRVALEKASEQFERYSELTDLLALQALLGQESDESDSPPPIDAPLTLHIDESPSGFLE